MKPKYYSTLPHAVLDCTNFNYLRIICSNQHIPGFKRKTSATISYGFFRTGSLPFTSSSIWWESQCKITAWWNKVFTWWLTKATVFFFKGGGVPDGSEMNTLYAFHFVYPNIYDHHDLTNVLPVCGLILSVTLILTE